MKKKTKKIFIYTSLAILLFGIAGIAHIYYYFFAPPFQITTKAYIYIDRDDDIDSVYTKIIEVGNPKQMHGFKSLVRYKGYTPKTGRYAILPEDNMRHLHRRLSMGYQTPVRLTIGSVRTLDRIARNASRQLMIDSVEIAKLLNDTAFIGKMGYNKETLPALFIPNTYEVYWNMSAEDFMQRMQKEHNAYWNEERMKKAEAIGLTPIEIATLASIVEEETANQAEKPIVAGLYINRLKRGMLLQADPTVKFSLKEFALKRILYKHLEVDSPYNTYKYAGLPPGPIRVPSYQGLESVLNYTKHNYIYMCAKEDFSGTHNFATNSAQHAANARKYQQALNKRGIR